MDRASLLNKVSESICTINLPHPTRVAIDGIDAAGKTTFADELAVVIRKHAQREVIRASVDDFLNPKEFRYRKGELSPEGFYLDSFNYDSFKKFLSDTLQLSNDSIVLVDGIFLLRPELIDIWDFKIFIDVSLETSIARGVKRGDADRRRYETRYMPGQKLYLSECQPTKNADIVIGNNDFNNPEIAMIHLKNQRKNQI